VFVLIYIINLSLGNPFSSVLNICLLLNFSVLEGFDPSFLNHFNNLQATQIDDLENVLLPHLHSSGSTSGMPIPNYSQSHRNVDEKELPQSQEVS